MAQDQRKDYYAVGGLNVDVNPYLSKDSELLACQNFYTYRLYAKKVRLGYKKLGTKASGDSGPVRNLIYFDFPNGERGILKVSNKRIWRYSFTTDLWSEAYATLTDDVRVSWTVLAGQTTYLHIVDGSGLYLIFDGVSFTQVSGGDTPNARFVLADNSRIIADRNQLRLAQSAVDFNLNSGYQTNPFLLNNNDPAGGGAISVDAGSGGKIVAITKAKGTPYIYKENAVYRFTGRGVQAMDYFDTVVPDTVVSNQKFSIDYFLSSGAIMKNDGVSITEASFGVNAIIYETISKIGLTNPFSGAWGNFTFFWMNNLIVSGEQVPNAMLVHDERFDEWYVWQTGHAMTAFGTFTDGKKAVRFLSGDDEGNVYVWGEEYSNDDGVSIPYRLRTKFFYLDYPEYTKGSDSIITSLAKDTGSTVAVAKDYDDDYIPLRGDEGGLTVGNADKTILRMFKSYSLEISGQTKDTRPEFYGHTIKYHGVSNQGKR